MSGSGHRIPCSATNIPEVVFDTPTELYDVGGQPIYVASALMEDSVHPCKCVPHLEPPCRVPYGGREHPHEGRFDILPVTQDMEWVPTSNGGIPYGRTPVEGGDASSALYSSCESLNFQPSDRVKVAVEMTLCELATAEHISVPLECKRMRTAASHTSIPQALARSAQHWSSYSGYLREIPQLCAAYRRLHEIDHAKSIYANITSEKISFLSSLNSHYSDLYLRQKELSALTEGLESLLRDLERYSSDLEHSITAVPLRADELASEIRARVVTLSEDVLADARALNSDAFASIENSLASILSQAQASFSLTTANTHTSIEAAIRSLDAAALSWNSRLVVFSQQLDAMWEETFDRKLALDQRWPRASIYVATHFQQRLDVMWEETFDRKLALEQAIDGMRERISQTDTQLELQLEATQKLQTLSSETSVSIERTNSQLLSASNTLSQELETLASVTQELQNNVTRLPDLMFKFNSAWLPGILGPLSSIWNGLQFPAWQAQLVMHVVGVGASGIQNSISALFTFGCALLFIMTHAFRYVSYLVGRLPLRLSRGKRPSQSQKRPQILTTRVYRRDQGNRSRLTSVLPRYETI
ncbi:unnamed protein product [Rhizoctonia solani]|uniref:Nuclear fusion protein KAR5 n=1 Tax=Rhizoctonia solani TaxID=456999 RepID=A0A8H3GTR1_9AGAM|nr:unnamed protein product [Rhizoctonia solani]